jgi:hypothetical protein
MSAEGPFVVDMLAVWGTAPDNVYIGGAFAQILRWDGNEIRLEHQLFNTNVWFKGIWGASADDVYAVGGDIFSHEGAIVHYDGGSWETVVERPLYGFRSISGSSPRDVFVVGALGTILHYDGVSWHEMTSPTEVELTGVYAASPRNVFAVGGYGTIIHYDGKTWRLMQSPTTSDLTAVWGVSGGIVYAVGSEGTLLRFAGRSWSVVDTGTTIPFNSICGTSAGNFFVADLAGDVLLAKGGSFTRLPRLTGKGLSGVWSPPHDPFEVFAVGIEGVVLHYERAHPQEASAASGRR